MTYYTAAQLTIIKQEINNYLATQAKKEVERYKTTAEVNEELREKHILLGIAHAIIMPYEAVDEDTDGIINNITEANLQTLVEKVYKAFPTLKYPE